MKNQKVIWLAIIMITSILGAWLILQPTKSPLQQANSSMATNVASAVISVPTNTIEAVVTNSVPPSVAESIPSNAVAINNAYEQGKISKAEAIQAVLMEENKQSLDFYGKVIDQSGRPVVGARIKGTVLLNVNFVRSGEEIHYTETDTEGNFSFIGLHGIQIGAWPIKEGYEMGGHGKGYQAPVGGKSSPTNRAIIKVWKLGEKAQLVSGSKFWGIIPDGRIYTLDLVQGTKVESANANGDLRISVSRPAGVSRQDHYDWSFQIIPINGGIIETEDDFMYEAPENGYAPEYDLHLDASVPEWTYHPKKSFYIKTRGGQNYGRINAEVFARYQDAGVFNIDWAVNPKGSRNLQP